MLGKYHRRTAKEARRDRRGWKRMTSALSFVVAIATVNALVLPAVTMNQDNCEVAEHQHTELCYVPGERTLICSGESLDIHRHEPDCYDEAGGLVCTLADFVVHSHEEACYDAAGALVCPLPEIEEHVHDDSCWSRTEGDPGHTHGEACYALVRSETLLCEQPESETHIHEDACYAMVQGDLTCTEEVRDPTESVSLFVCKKPQVVLHTHDEDCYELVSKKEGSEGWLAGMLQKDDQQEEKVLVCTEPEIKEHQHDASCFTTGETVLGCNIPEHTHGDDCKKAEPVVEEKKPSLVHTHDTHCYDTVGTLLCPLEEVAAHTHSDACYQLTEADPGHTHSDACYAWTRGDMRLCIQEESETHTHTDECYVKEQGDLICTEEERAAGEAVSLLVCEKPQMILHTHGIGCYDEENVLLCTLPEVQEHLHGEACFREDGTLDCVALKTPEEITSPAEEEESMGLSEVIALIQALPAKEDVEGDLAALTGEELLAYQSSLTAQVNAALAGYNGLSDEHKTLVYNYNTLAELDALLDPQLPEEEPTETEGTLEFAADGHTTTLTISEEANLPADTVVNADALYDSNEPSVAAFSLEETEEDDGSQYAEQILSAVTWGEVTRIKLFDITLTSGSTQVQPAAPVQVRTEFPEPLSLSENEILYGVHIGENGVDILPATTERDENGNVIAMTHTQSSFSPTGYVYVLTHDFNANDIGPNIMPVHYCIWVNDQWVIAGSTRTGWYGNYTSADDWTTDTRDYITMEQMLSVLGPYGLSVDYTDGLNEEEQNVLTRTIWYQRAENIGKTIRHDTTPVKKEINGENMWVFQLSGNKVKDSGYHIYYVPEGTLSGKENDPTATYPSNQDLGNDLKEESKFFTVTVRDRQGLVYDNSGEDKLQEKIPPVQTLKYGEKVVITVLANIENNQNLGWQWVNDKGAVVNGQDPYLNDQKDDRFTYTDNGDGTETYSFSGILGRTTLIPFANSVDGAEIDNTKQVDVAVHLDGKWQKVGQINLMYKKEGACVDETTNESLWFITAGQAYSVLKDFGFDPKYTPDDEANKGHVFTHAIGAFSEDMVMHADGINENIGGTGVAIGFGHEKMMIDGQEVEPKNFTLFYVPGSGQEEYDQVHNVSSKAYGQSDLIQGDRFYSVTVKDEYQLVYYGHETDAFKVYIPEGQAAAVQVLTTDQVLWSVRQDTGFETSEYEMKQGTNSYQIFELTTVNGPLSIEASLLSPNFTVQYYANIERYELSKTAGENTVPLIDTTGKKLPTNTGTTTDTKDLLYLQLQTVDEEGKPLGTTSQNAGNGPAQLYGVKTYIDNTKIYKDEAFNFEYSPEWENIDKLWNNMDYKIEAIWILKDGMDPETTNESDWWIYKSQTNGANITFTNRAAEETAPKREDQNVYPADQNYTILITEGMIIRLHYHLAIKKTDLNSSFYDYDISSDGRNVGQKGINSPHSGKTNTSNRYAFGNDNCYTGMGTARWNNNELNQYNNAVNKAYKGCTFELVKSIDTAGKITWGSGITGLNIFGSTETTGKTNYSGSLTFRQRGDVYTLSGTNVKDVGSRDGLNRFFHPSPANGTTHTHIFTNNFWIMDGVPAAKRKDGLWGRAQDALTGTDSVTGYSAPSANTRSAGTTTGVLPPSDDGNPHNWFFGMSFAVNFNITEDYLGPMEYIFFGDDDMWVFLDSDTNGDGTMDKSELICDIGGVHSSVGEYVNLRDYLPVDGPYTTGKHVLRFYYTERGASGSTCWMSFTLPSVSSATLDEGTSELVLRKTVKDLAEQELITTDRFEFKLGLYTDETKTTSLTTPFAIEITKPDGNVEYYSTMSGSSLLIGGGDTAIIYGLPIGTYYVVEEVQDDRFTVVANGAEGYVVEGTTEEEIAKNVASFINTFKGYRLPDTGGTGTSSYILGGSVVTMLALVIYMSTRNGKSPSVPTSGPQQRTRRSRR